jgi:hypothetical protein
MALFARLNAVAFSAAQARARARAETAGRLTLPPRLSKIFSCTCAASVLFLFNHQHHHPHKACTIYNLQHHPPPFIVCASFSCLTLNPPSEPSYILPPSPSPVHQTSDKSSSVVYVFAPRKLLRNPSAAEAANISHLAETL